MLQGGNLHNNPFVIEPRGGEPAYITQMFYVHFENCTYKGHSPNVARRTHPSGVQFGWKDTFDPRDDSDQTFGNTRLVSSGIVQGRYAPANYCEYGLPLAPTRAGFDPAAWGEWEITKPAEYEVLDPLSMLSRSAGEPGDVLEDMEFMTKRSIHKLEALKGATRENVGWILNQWDCMEMIRQLIYGMPKDPAHNWVRINVFTMTAGCGKSTLAAKHSQLVDVDTIIDAPEYKERHRELRRIAIETGDWTPVHISYGACLREYLQDKTAAKGVLDEALCSKLFLVHSEDMFGPGVEVKKWGGAKLHSARMAQVVAERTALGLAHAHARGLPPYEADVNWAKLTIMNNMNSTDPAMDQDQIVAAVERAWLSMHSIFPIH
jgi:hypothetical protein